MTKKDAGTKESTPADIRKMNFEECFRALEEVVDQLEGGEVGLEDSIKVYARGMHLKRHCEEKLTSAREQVEKVVVGSTGEIDTEAANID